MERRCLRVRYPRSDMSDESSSGRAPRAASLSSAALVALLVSGCFRLSTPVRPDVVEDGGASADVVGDRAVDRDASDATLMGADAADDGAADSSAVDTGVQLDSGVVIDGGVLVDTGVAIDARTDAATDAAEAGALPIAAPRLCGGDSGTCASDEYCAGGVCVPEATLHGGAEHMCLRVRDQYTCWGMSTNGATGNAVGVAVATPPAVRAPGTSGPIFGMANYGYSTEFIFGADRSVGYLGGQHAFGNTSAGNSSGTLVPVPGTAGTLSLATPSTSGVRCSVTMDRRVRCWGCNRNGALGVGSAIGDRCAADSNAQTLPLANVAQVAVARSYTGDGSNSASVCALFDSGIVRCWGINDRGQRGVGTTGAAGDVSVSAALAPDIAGHRFTQLTSAESSFCGVTVSGEVWCWGESEHFRGPGTSEPVNRPVPMIDPATAAFSSIRRVQCGSLNCCALERGTNALRCWGFQRAGTASGRVVPGGPMTDGVTPTLITVPGIAPGSIEDLGMGDAICVLGRASENPSRRRVVCWGENDHSQCGASPASPTAGFTTVAITAPGF